MPGIVFSDVLQSLNTASLKHPLPSTPIKYSYGTAGFRMKAELLDPVFYRVGILAALRSKALNGQTIGIMITASHNPPEDNGVKLIDPLGEMLEEPWEHWACALANAQDLDAMVKQIVEKCHIDLQQPARVVVGRDTRPSGATLLLSLMDGLQVFQCAVKDLGLATTPQLHYITRCCNDPDFGEPSLHGYCTQLAKAFNELMPSMPPTHLVIDCANGVGAIALQDLAAHLPPHLTLTLTHTQLDQPQLLNHQCGADYVKTHQRAPDPLAPNTLYASLDGDADRVVFYYHDGAQFKLLDGDKVACLFATYFHAHTASLGVVQTAYANGESTKYLARLGVPVVCTPTGVKHLHAAAHRFETGIYFEANGHGTVLVPRTSPFARLLNPTVGDAVSDVLAVLVVLHLLHWSVANWDQMYTDAPNRLWKVEVADRTVFATTDAERKLVAPRGCQAYIDAAVARVPHGRAFVRPSGTENVVRVYAEAATRDACEWLGRTVAGVVFDLGGGVGERPSAFLKWEGAVPQ